MADEKPDEKWLDLYDDDARPLKPGAAKGYNLGPEIDEALEKARKNFEDAKKS